MQTILIANPKGGCGKTTIAVNIAGYFARQGLRVVLSDLDRQRSALHWLERRPGHLPTIHGWDGRDRDGLDVGFKPQVVVLDAPAGQRGRRLKLAAKHVDRVLIPVQPSPMDMDAAGDFLELLAELKRVRKGKCPIALVGNRIRAGTHSEASLRAFFERLDSPVLGMLRDAQVYLQLAAEGASLFDLPRYRVSKDLRQWRPLLGWLESGAA